MVIITGIPLRTGTVQAAMAGPGTGEVTGTDRELMAGPGPAVAMDMVRAVRDGPGREVAAGTGDRGGLG